MVPALKAGIRRAHPLRDEVTRHAQTLIREVAVDSKTGLCAKQAHHIILTEIKGVRKRIDADVLSQVRVEVFKDSGGLFGAVLRGSLGRPVVIQSAAKHDQQLQHLRACKQIVPVGRALLLRLERIQRAQQRGAAVSLRAQDKALPICRQMKTGVERRHCR